MPPVWILPPRLLGVGDEGVHRVEAARVGERAHGDALLQAVADLDALGVFGEALEEARIDVLLHIEARRRDADLAGVAILERGDGVGRLLRIGVGEHHDRRMAAELHGGALHALGGELREMLADRDRAGERDFPHRVLGEQMLGHLRPARRTRG